MLRKIKNHEKKVTGSAADGVSPTMPFDLKGVEKFLFVVWEDESDNLTDSERHEWIKNFVEGDQVDRFKFDNWVEETLVHWICQPDLYDAVYESIDIDALINYVQQVIDENYDDYFLKE